MAAHASIEVDGVPLSRASVQIGVYRYFPDGPQKYVGLPNVRVLSIVSREGPDPGMARFKYVFDPVDPETDPTCFEDALSTESILANVVQNDERLVVLREDGLGNAVPLFDGFAQVPELALAPAQELVSFVAYGVAVREWDRPVVGCLMRDSDDLVSGQDLETELSVEFNRDGRPNASPLGADARDGQGREYPVFVDSLVVREPDTRRHWTLPMVVRYLCCRHNPGESYVRNPRPQGLDELLDARMPKAGVTMDPADPTTYVSRPIIVGEYDPTGKPWPIALNDLLNAHGFGMVFRLDTDAAGDPTTRLELFRKQDAASGTYKWLALQPPGERLDPGRSNVAHARLARDTARVANSYSVEGGPVLYEASFILAPGFSVSAADASTADNLKQFERNSADFSLIHRDRYRLFVFDETGEGHWDFATARLVRTATQLDGLFAADGDRRTWVKRRRVPASELLTVDANRKPLRARLAVSTDYSGPNPGLWYGTGTWQPITGGFDLLKDRLGIWVNVLNPNGWSVGMPTAPGLPFPAGVLRLVELLANASVPRLSLRLTCVIEGDRVVKGNATRRPSSSSSYTIHRRIDASGRYRKRVIAPRSEFNPTANAVASLDDSGAAADEAAAHRLANEAGEVAGDVVIPRFTSVYQIGDKICAILGRGLSLRTNAGAPREEAPVFPTVVGIAWDFEHGQRTVIQLSDHRGEGARR